MIEIRMDLSLRVDVAVLGRMMLLVSDCAWLVWHSADKVSASLSLF